MKCKMALTKATINIRAFESLGERIIKHRVRESINVRRRVE